MMCLQWSVLRTSDVSPKCCARYIFLRLVNKFGDVLDWSQFSFSLFWCLANDNLRYIWLFYVLNVWIILLLVLLLKKPFRFRTILFFHFHFHVSASCLTSITRVNIVTWEFCALIWLAYLTFCVFLQSKPIKRQKLRQRPLPMPSVPC